MSRGQRCWVPGVKDKSKSELRFGKSSHLVGAVEDGELILQVTISDHLVALNLAVWE